MDCGKKGKGIYLFWTCWRVSGGYWLRVLVTQRTKTQEAEKNVLLREEKSYMYFWRCWRPPDAYRCKNIGN